MREDAQGGQVEGDRLPRALVVVGAHLRAERLDRGVGYRLAHAMEAWFNESDVDTSGAAPGGKDVVVCSDLWYLNHDELRDLPTVSVGGPGVNALTAFLADKLPSALAVDDAYVVQFDAQLCEPVAACWGSGAEGTAHAVEAFVGRYLDGFLSGLFPA